MWFDKKNRKTRTETLLNEVQFYNPDIVALQEVVEESLEIIIAKMTPTYYLIGMNPHRHGHSESHYDTIILSKFPPLQWDRYYLPNTRMGRNLLLTTLQTPTRQISVGTFHLESVFFKKNSVFNQKNNQAEELKEAQLRYIYAISPMNTILMGDTNLINDEFLSKASTSPSASSNKHLIDIYYTSQKPKPQDPSSVKQAEDLGAQEAEDLRAQEAEDLGVCPFPKGAGVCPFSKGAGAEDWATYCGPTNKNIKNKTIQSRLDRIYVKIMRDSLKVHFYGLTGTLTQPSDHFGVFGQIEI